MAATACITTCMHVHPCMNSHLPLLPPSGVFNSDSRRTVSAFLSSKLEPYTSAHGTTTVAAGETGAHDASAADVEPCTPTHTMFLPIPARGDMCGCMGTRRTLTPCPKRLRSMDSQSNNMQINKLLPYVQLLSATPLNMNALRSHAVIPLKTHHPPEDPPSP